MTIIVMLTQTNVRTFGFCANDVIKVGSKHTYQTHPGKHKAFMSKFYFPPAHYVRVTRNANC